MESVSEAEKSGSVICYKREGGNWKEPPAPLKENGKRLLQIKMETGMERPKKSRGSSERAPRELQTMGYWTGPRPNNPEHNDPNIQLELPMRERPEERQFRAWTESGIELLKSIQWEYAGKNNLNQEVLKCNSCEQIFVSEDPQGEFHTPACELNQILSISKSMLRYLDKGKGADLITEDQGKAESVDQGDGASASASADAFQQQQLATALSNHHMATQQYAQYATQLAQCQVFVSMCVWS